MNDIEKLEKQLRIATRPHNDDLATCSAMNSGKLCGKRADHRILVKCPFGHTFRRNYCPDHFVFAQRTGLVCRVCESEGKKQIRMVRLSDD